MEELEKECDCGHLDYEHVDARDFNESVCRQCNCMEFNEKETS